MVGLAKAPHPGVTGSLRRKRRRGVVSVDPGQAEQAAKAVLP